MKIHQYTRFVSSLSFLFVQTILPIPVDGKVLAEKINRNNHKIERAVKNHEDASGRNYRYLEGEDEKEVITKEEETEIGSAVEDIIHNDKDENDSENEKDDKDNNKEDGYVPHPYGTPVRFEDQDGTWMSGIIVDYNSGSKKYTIQWDEDDLKEEFSDFGKVDKLVNNAKNQSDDEKVKEDNAKEKKNDQDEDEDEDEGEKYEDEEDKEDARASAATSEEKNTSTTEDSKSNDKNSEEKSNSKSNGEKPPSSSSYQGTVPENFDFGYTYKYEDLSQYDPWPIGTLTLLEFQDGYYEGKITSFELSEDNKIATYVVTWSDDTTDKFINELEWMDLMVENAKQYEPWDIGTETYGYPNPKEGSNEPFLAGKISSFENGAYKVTWSNGDVIVYNDFDMVDALVSNAGMHNEPSSMENYRPWPIGTPVSWDFDDGWWDGTISGFSDGTYEVTWSDESTKNYSNLEKIDQMVQYAAIGDDDYDYGGGPGNYGDGNNAYEYYPVGTLVYANFEDGWWAGNVDSYDGDYYVVKWSDNTFDNFLPGPEVDKMVENTQLLSFQVSGIYPIGTQVYNEFEGKWYWGSIEYNAGGLYTILWSDGERSYYMSGAEMNKMVGNANSKQGMSTVGKVFLSFFVLGSVAAIVFIYLKKGKRKKKSSEVTEQVKESELDSAGEENGLVTKEKHGTTTIEYSDEVDEDTATESSASTKTPSFV